MKGYMGVHFQSVLTKILLLALSGGAITICLPAHATSSQVVPPGKVVAWGWSAQGRTAVPEDLTNAVQVAGSESFSLVLQSDGRVRALPSWAPFSEDALFGATAIACGRDFAMALRRDGTVVAVGGDGDIDQYILPPSATNVISIDGQYYTSAAVREDGTVITSVGGGMWTEIPRGDYVLPGVSNVVSISTSYRVALLLTSEGNVGKMGYLDIPEGLGDIKAVAAGNNHGLALRTDGTVVAWGKPWPQGGALGGPGLNVGQDVVPEGLSNVVAIAAGHFFSLALKADGTVVHWGSNIHGEGDVPSDLRNVTAIGAGAYHCLAIVGPPPGNLPPLSISLEGDEVKVSTDQNLSGVLWLEESKDLVEWHRLQSFGTAGHPLRRSIRIPSGPSASYLRLTQP